MFEIDVGGYVNVVVGSYETGGGYVEGYCFGDDGGVGWGGRGGSRRRDGKSSGSGNEIDVCSCISTPVGDYERGGGFVKGYWLGDYIWVGETLAGEEGIRIGLMEGVSYLVGDACRFLTLLVVLPLLIVGWVVVMRERRVRRRAGSGRFIIALRIARVVLLASKARSERWVI